jgi:hypothetical protein
VAAVPWQSLAETALVELLNEESACVWPEIEAKLGEPDDDDGLKLQPHILTRAKNALLDRGEIVQTPPMPTRGGREFVTLHLPVARGNKLRIETAAGRKRLLQTRYLSLALPSARQPRGLIGPGGEAVLHASLRVAAVDARLSLIQPEGGEVTHLLGAPVPGGPVDSAAWHASSRGGVSGPPILAMIEAKNVRSWLYPSAEEVHQVLHKAALLQRAFPDQPILPVLVCRRRHYWLHKMGILLGFYIVETHRQFVLPSSDIVAADFEQLRSELGYRTLTITQDADEEHSVPAFLAVPTYATALAEKWHDVGSQFVDHYATLRDGRLSPLQRETAALALKLDVQRTTGETW